MANRKFRRLPNGFGAIVHLSGKLRNPYLAKRRAGSDPLGRPVYRTVGTFPTYSEAFDALAAANRIGETPDAGITFAEMYGI